MQMQVLHSDIPLGAADPERFNQLSSVCGNAYSSRFWIDCLADILELDVRGRVLVNDVGDYVAASMYVRTHKQITGVPYLRCASMLVMPATGRYPSRAINWYHKCCESLLAGIEEDNDAKLPMKLDLNYGFTDPRCFQWHKYSVEPKCSLVINTSNANAMAARMKPEKRKQVNRGQRAGFFEVGEFDLNAAYQILCETVLRVHGRAPSMSKDVFIRLITRLVDAGLVVPIGIGVQEGDLGAFAFLALDQARLRAHAWLLGTSDKWNRLGITAFIYSRVMDYCCRQGMLELDLDHGNIEAVARMKQDLGAVPRLFFRIRKEFA